MPLQAVDSAAASDESLVLPVTLRRCAPVPRGVSGPWLLTGSASEGDAAWFEVDGTAGERVGFAVLVRREERQPAADVGYAPARGADDPGLVAPALRLLAEEAFRPLGLERLDTRLRPGDAATARALDQVGFVFVGYDRRRRHVWSVVERLLR